MYTKNEKITKAYNFMIIRCKKKAVFSISDLANETGWKESTVKSYISKKWRDILIQEGKNYRCNNCLLKIPLDKFIRTHSQVTKLFENRLDDKIEHLKIKAQQFALLAISSYNNPYSKFKTYGYIVNIIIAWTALMYARACSKKIDCYCKNKNGEYICVNGQRKVWSISKFINKSDELKISLKANLIFLIKLRNVIEHDDTPEIDIKIAGLCQACLNNFEKTFTNMFGDKWALSDTSCLALQLTKTHDQNLAIQELQKSHPDFVSFLNCYENKLEDDIIKSEEYRVAFFFEKKISNKKTMDCEVVEFTSATENHSPEDIEKMYIKEVEKPKHLPTQIIDLMQQAGYRTFNMHKHTQLWKKMDAKSKDKGYGTMLAGKSWYWYDSWLKVVRDHCKKK